MPIVFAPINKKLIIIKILANNELKKHLESLGITINSEITVLSNSGGTTICYIKEGKIALDSNLSTKILVKEM